MVSFLTAGHMILSDMCLKLQLPFYLMHSHIGSKQCTPTKGLLHVYYIGDKQCRGTLIGPYSIGGLDTNRVSIAYNMNAPVYRRYTVWRYTVCLL